MIDLHTHSTYSDGSFTPVEILKAAKDIGLTAVALTDHNTVLGLPEFISNAKTMGINAVPGVELTTEYDGNELHLILLFIKEESYNTINEFVFKYRELKRIGNLQMIERLRSAGYDICYDDIEANTPTGNINRTHVAKELVKKGYFSTTAEVFDSILSEKFGFYVPTQKMNTADAIRFGVSIDAIPILAHPLDNLSESDAIRIIPELKSAGLVGMEVAHSSYDKRKNEQAIKIATDNSLLFSGGSDFHGTVKQGIYLGVGKGDMNVPDDYYHKLINIK